MRHISLLLAMLLAPLPLAAAEPAAKSPSPPARADTPRSLGNFEAWTAAIHHEGDMLVCYAFTRAHGSSTKIAGRGDVVLSVTERPSGRGGAAASR